MSFKFLVLRKESIGLNFELRSRLLLCEVASLLCEATQGEAESLRSTSRDEIKLFFSHRCHREIELRMTPAVAEAMAGKIDEYDLRKAGKFRR